MNTTEAIVIERIYNSPVDLVWKAWTDPEQLKKWWAPNGCSTPYCTVDLRVGGKFHFCMRMPDGKEVWALGIYKEIVEGEKIVYTDVFSDSEGNPRKPATYGFSPEHPEESLVTVIFSEESGKTKVTLHHSLSGDFKEKKEMEQGWLEMFNKLVITLKETHKI